MMSNDVNDESDYAVATAANATDDDDDDDDVEGGLTLLYNGCQSWPSPLSAPLC